MYNAPPPSPFFFTQAITRISRNNFVITLLVRSNCMQQLWPSTPTVNRLLNFYLPRKQSPIHFFFHSTSVLLAWWSLMIRLVCSILMKVLRNYGIFLRDHPEMRSGEERRVFGIDNLKKASRPTGIMQGLYILDLVFLLLFTKCNGSKFHL